MPAAKPKPNVLALRRTLKAMGELGRLEQVDDALVELCKSTAAAVDRFPERASLVKEYRECLLLLGGLGGSDDGDELARLLAEMGNPSTS